MTSNQIRYAEYLETKRHNLAGENFTSREVATQEMNAATNRLNYAESNRHNVASENLTAQANKENIRHNKEQERISYGSLLESKRHNISSEQLTEAQLSEVRRHNISYEEMEREKIAQDAKRIALQERSLQESVRHNIAAEGVSAIQAQASKTSAAASTVSARAAQQNADTRVKELDLAKDVEKRNVKQQVIDQYQTEEKFDVERERTKAQFVGGAFSSLVRFGASFIP